MRYRKNGREREERTRKECRMLGKEIITEIVFSVYVQLKRTSAHSFPSQFCCCFVFSWIYLGCIEQHANILEFCQRNTTFECSFFLIFRVEFSVENDGIYWYAQVILLKLTNVYVVISQANIDNCVWEIRKKLPKWKWKE